MLDIHFPESTFWISAIEFLLVIILISDIQNEKKNIPVIQNAILNIQNIFWLVKI